MVAAVIAALGVALVFVYARGADSRAADKYDAVEVLTASQEIQPGESLDDAIDSGKVKLTYVAEAQLLDGATDETDKLDGDVALVTIYPGEQLVPIKFGGEDEVKAASVLPIPKGKLAISISVEDDARVGEFIQAGAEVAIIITRPKDSNDPIESRILLERVTVLADGLKTNIDSGDDEEGITDADIERLITVAVTQREAEKVRFAERAGDLSIGLLNDASKVERDGGVTLENLFK
ncbi:Flp pilus assembly protein CpaB [Nocardioides caeni]|uniref:Flp pilus assembly protein CpaB n=1 Tax=Nocardioides caeni TaxID=574700 RepID=UPI00130536AB|nr:Flp pilus assembly protein CpaB [Nocardioides caeni]